MSGSLEGCEQGQRTVRQCGERVGSGQVIEGSAALAVWTRS